ncbi:MAG: maleylacetoacetate isomerase [Sphingomonadaceae bacterium]|nr:maleylacetoacetate isomerase [Sphingomonadaceae bacterium]
MAIRLYDYFRSSAAYRVRIALNLKGLDYERVPIDLREGTQRGEDYRARNPQGLVPMLEIDGATLTQSLAIIEYLDARFPDPALLPQDDAERARVRAMALLVACDIHPLNNLRVLQYLKQELGHEQDVIDAWIRHWIGEGFAALETIARHRATPFLSGDRPGLADICLIPQMYNARRFDTPLGAFPTLVAADAAATRLDAFAAAQPEQAA